MPKTICLDFDGVLNTYDGWKGEDELFEPRGGVSSFLEVLTEEFDSIVIHSTRPAEKLAGWLAQHKLAHPKISTTDKKPPAICYVDDRAVRFDGDFQAILPHILTFKTFWENAKNGGFGATGQFPEGKNHIDDEGELRFGVAADKRNRTVVLNFGKPVAWMGFSPEMARQLAATLLKNAAICEKGTQ